MSRRGENIRKRKDLRWEGRYIQCYDASGKAKYHSIYGKSYSEVKKKLKEITHKKNVILPQRSDIKDCCFEKILQEWLDTKRLVIKASTYAKYYCMLRKHIAPSLGQVSISKINAHEINRFILEKADSKELSPSTLKTTIYLMKGGLEYASVLGYCLPIKGIISSLPLMTKETVILSNTEQRLLEQYLFRQTDRLNFGILLCLYTGLRLGEICGLRWEDIDLKSRLLYVNRSIQRIKNFEETIKSKTILQVGTPKTFHSFRCIPIPWFLVEMLRQCPGSKSGYFLTDQVERFIDPRTYQNHFKRLLKNTGLPPKNFHILRHTFATRCIENGFDSKILSQILGHANVNITLNRYVHPSIEHRQVQMDALSPILPKEEIA